MAVANSRSSLVQGAFSLQERIEMTNKPEVTRRSFLQTSASAGGRSRRRMAVGTGVRTDRQRKPKAANRLHRHGTSRIRFPRQNVDGAAP